MGNSKDSPLSPLSSQQPKSHRTPFKKPSDSSPKESKTQGAPQHPLCSPSHATKKRPESSIPPTTTRHKEKKIITTPTKTRQFELETPFMQAPRSPPQRILFNTNAPFTTLPSNDPFIDSQAEKHDRPSKEKSPLNFMKDYYIQSPPKWGGPRVLFKSHSSGQAAVGQYKRSISLASTNSRGHSRASMTGKVESTKARGGNGKQHRSDADEDNGEDDAPSF
ncbi:hypothetical protein B0J11DRAFT_502526 [Dendryphion nanum]|uniref:Uncharacterized protein n=1 Tax=Dendryphion nanum TaxID=256645 RepID=A0A9P9EFN4_9PLEO|nr:hypothetical protein B0J11DRAFT_502526 [Dendryphion nanum]